MGRPVFWSLQKKYEELIYLNSFLEHIFIKIKRVFFTIKMYIYLL